MAWRGVGRAVAAPSGRRAAPAPVEALRCPAVPGRRGGLGGRFPLGPGRPGVGLRPEARQGRAGTRVTGKSPSGSHGQVRNNLLEGDASFCTLQGSEVMFDGSQMFNRLVDSPVRNMYWQEVGVT